MEAIVEDDSNSLTEEQKAEITKELMKFLKMLDMGEVGASSEYTVEFRDIVPIEETPSNVVYVDFERKKK